MSEPQNPVPQEPEQILDRPVVIGDFDAELKKTKRGMGKLTIGLGAAVLLVAAFFGGVATHAAIAEPSATTAQQPQRAPGQRFPGQGGQGGQVPGGTGTGTPRGTAGSIDHVDGTDVYVKTADGKTVKVSTSDTTRVRISQDGKLADLKPGSTVIVQGDTGSDGTVAAQTITEQQFARG